MMGGDKELGRCGTVAGSIEVAKTRKVNINN